LKTTNSVITGAILGLCLLVSTQQANATYIRGAVSADTVLIDQGANYSVDNVIDQSGLSTGYTDGDDFATSVAFVTHDWDPLTEWWTAWDTAAGSVVFDLGGYFTLDKVAFWNEDAAGVRSLTISVSQNIFDSSNTGTNVGTFTPTNNAYAYPTSYDYAADIFSFDAEQSVRYVRFDLTAAEEEAYSGKYTLSMGEVAFSVAEPIPEPATMLLFSVGLVGLFGASRKRS